MTKLGLLLAAGAFALCANEACSSVQCADTLTCADGGSNDGTLDSNAPDEGFDGNIDPTKGVFVSPSGEDTNDGSEQNPLKTIGVGLTKAKSAAKSRVYICAGTYAENVDVKDAIDLLGGFACADWSYATTNDATIAPPSGIALHVEGVSSTISDLKFVAPDATNAGDSSIAAFASSATLTLLRDDIEAGKGMSATQPAAQTDFSPAQATNGDTGKMNSGGAQTPNTCTNGSGNSTGGAGGPPGQVNGAKGQPFGSYPVNPAAADGSAGDSSKACNAGGGGSDGSYGPGGSAGVGSAKLGTLDATGWTPVAGATGGVGDVGEGGGGGASLDGSGGGGGGGAGGCGGVGGTGGPSGGSSIALLLFQTSATLTQTTLGAKDAGDGAKGGTGQKAQGGGAGGVQFSGECGGGAGGHGGSGGGGGGGAGGVSAGVLYSGTAPTIDGTSTPSADTLTNVTVGNAGALGAGGDGGPAYKTANPASNAGASGNPGPAGAAKAVMQAP